MGWSEAGSKAGLDNKSETDGVYVEADADEEDGVDSNLAFEDDR